MRRRGVISGMVRAATRNENAMIESFWATLKAECFVDGRPATQQIV